MADERTADPGSPLRRWRSQGAYRRTLCPTTGGGLRDGTKPVALSILRTAPAPAGVTDGGWPVAAVRSEADGVGGGGSIPPFVTAAPTVAGRLDLGVGWPTRGRLAPENCCWGSGGKHSVLDGTKYVHSSRGRAVRAAKCGCKPSQPGTIRSTLCGLPHRAPRSVDTPRPPGPCWTPTPGKRDATGVDGVSSGS